MAWITLPIENIVGDDLSANMLANSVGTSLDDMLTIALGINSQLSTGIEAIKTAWDDALAALSNTYSLTLGTNTYTAPTSSTSAPDYSASFESAITLGIAPTMAPAPTVGALSAIATAPTAPSVGGILTTEYANAYALARQQALDDEANDVWQASFGAAASGRGLPLAAQQVAVQQAAVRRLKAISTAALDASRLQASHLREDTRWSYEQRLAYWAKIEEATLQHWKTEQSVAVELWAQKVEADIKAYQSLSGITISKTQASAAILAQRYAAETARFGALIQNLELGLREVAEKRQWFAADGELKVKDAMARAQDAREIQKILVETGEKAVYAYAAALAEQMKAWLSALSYQVQAQTSIRGDSAITPP